MLALRMRSGTGSSNDLRHGSGAAAIERQPSVATLPDGTVHEWVSVNLWWRASAISPITTLQTQSTGRGLLIRPTIQIAKQEQNPEEGDSDGNL